MPGPSPRTNIDRLDKLRQDLGLDGILVTSPLNTQFFTGCLILTQRLLPSRMAVIAGGAAGYAFVVCEFEERQAQTDSAIRDIRSYTEFTESPIDVAARTLNDLGGLGRIGFESRHLVAQMYLELQTVLPGAQFVPIDHELAAIRAVKSREEIDLLRDAFSITDDAIASGYIESEAGDSTRHIVGRMKKAMVERGADETAFAVIGAGRDTLSGHPAADERPLERGDAIRVDFGGLFHGYYTDLARSAFFGEATTEQLDVYRRLWNSLEQLVAAVIPGAEARDIYAAGRQALIDSGLSSNGSDGRWEMPLVGHGIGLEIHEFPVLESLESASLMPGMVCCVELMYTKPDEFRLHIEDAVVVTETGSEVLSRTRDWSEPLVVGTH